MTASNPTIRETGKGRPLDGFRVPDLTRFLSGPYCTMVLAELGADVIKVEQPGTGDDSRRMAPKINGESYPFAMPNRSKRSIALDLKSERGRELFHELVGDYRGSGNRKLPPWSHASTRPSTTSPCVDGSATTSCTARSAGSARPAPYRDRPGFDIMAQGIGGFLRMTLEPDGKPTKVGIAINDIAAGATAIYSILAAELERLEDRRRPVHRHLTRGCGPGLDSAGIRRLLLSRRGAGLKTGTRHRRSAPYQAYRTGGRLRHDRRQHRPPVAAADQRRPETAGLGRRSPLRRSASTDGSSR